MTGVCLNNVLNDLVFGIILSRCKPASSQQGLGDFYRCLQVMHQLHHHLDSTCFITIGNRQWCDIALAPSWHLYWTKTKTLLNGWSTELVYFGALCILTGIAYVVIA